jgi:hypothetical protein
VRLVGVSNARATAVLDTIIAFGRYWEQSFISMYFSIGLVAFEGLVITAEELHE